MSREFDTREITKLLNLLVGDTEPVADSALDHQIEDNVKVLIDVVNWCLDGLYDTARHRKSDYGSQRDVGERAYAALLEWEEWLRGVEEELA